MGRKCGTQGSGEEYVQSGFVALCLAATV